MARLKKAPLIVLATVLLGGGGLIYAVSSGKISPASSGPAAVPMQANLPTLADAPTASPVAVAEVALPSTQPANVSAPEIRLQEMGWNAQTGLNFANGGITTTAGSLMQKHGVNLRLVWEDDVGKQMSALVNFAKAFKKNPQPTEGAHFVTIMGDGSAATIGSALKDLQEAGVDPEVIGSAGYSRGEDQLMGLPAWKQNPQLMRGSLISGYLRDGDWNIALKFAGDNNIPNNPDEKTYDPTAINWYSADDYIKAADAYIDGPVCEDRPVVIAGKRTGEKKNVCVNGVVTWTPGDVNVAEKRGGLATIVSTKDYRSQMPHTIIGLKQWDQANKGLVVEMLAAMFEGGDQVNAYKTALHRGCEVNSVVWSGDNGAGRKSPDYWQTYFLGVTKADKAGVTVSLGGSSANGLQDNLVLFGLNGGANYFAATYTLFGSIVKQQYPKLAPSMLPVEKVLNTEYVQAVNAKYGKQQMAAADMPKFNVNTQADTSIGDKPWQINFDTGKSTFTAGSASQLSELLNGLLIANGALIEIQGHTDNQGDSGRNQALSLSRAQAVKTWLVQQGVDGDRFVKVEGRGDAEPVATNETDSGKAKNRRVVVKILRTKATGSVSTLR